MMLGFLWSLVYVSRGGCHRSTIG